MKVPVVIAVLAALAPTSSARAVETETLFDGRVRTEWQTRRDAARIEQELAVSQVESLPEAGELRWRFATKGPAFNDLFLAKPIDGPFAGIRFRVRCAGEPLTLACKAVDARGAEWTASQVKLQTDSAWRWVEMPVADWKVASWSKDGDGRMDFPLSMLAIIAFDVRPGVAYDLRVSQIDVVRPDRPVIQVSRCALPAQMTHGKTYPTPLAFTVSKPAAVDGAWLVFTQGASEAFRLPVALPAAATALKPGQEVRLPALKLTVPEFASGGRLKVTLHVGDGRAPIRVGAKGGDGMVQVEGRKPGTVTAAVKLHNGTPTLLINGKPHTGMMYTAYGPSRQVFEEFARAGVDLFSFSATPTEAGYGLSKTVWKAPGVYDYSELDERVAMVLQANPNARFFPRLYLHAPRWWSEAHPDDIVQMDPGDGKPVPFIHAGDKPAPSWASEAWRRDTADALRRLIAHVEASPYADRCIGYHIASGTTEEWMMWGGNEDQWVDYSPANTKAFRKWLRTKYGSDDALRKAWRRPDATLDTAAVPTKAARMAASGALRDPATDQPSIDYALYTSDLVADTIAHFCRVIKEATHGAKIAGAFYGYLLQLCGEQRQQNAGHLALEKVLACPDLDFMCSPTSYAFREIGGKGTSHFMSLFGSIKLHGKLWFNENDIRTSISQGAVGEWGRPADVAGDIIQQDKESGHVLAQGAGQWWFDVGANRYDAPELMARIGVLNQTALRALPQDKTRADQVAFVVDEGSLTRLRVPDVMGAALLVLQLPALHRIGAPVGHYLQSDLPRLADRKLFIFPTSFAPTAADRRSIEALKGGGRVLVFLYAPGAYRDGELDEASMEALTGIRLRLDRAPRELKVALNPGDARIQDLGLPGFGGGYLHSPSVRADDPAAVTLGSYPDGAAGFVVKRFRDWTAVFCGAPQLPASLLRRLARSAGVHQYVEGDDVVWASRGVVSVCVDAPGERTIRLPGRSRVTDLTTGATLAHDAAELRLPFAQGQTRIFGVTPLGR
jgi:hypothetical protein